ncbi:MAG: PPOX class probable FMN-dependent enzyme [Alphaproteobacteria bacterium]|jgi:PPOX class probable FMN-dependent enzyme
MTFPRWRQSLARSLHVQRSRPESKFFQVANAYLSTKSQHAGDIVVENRTMVFRGFGENSHTLLAITDDRSDKITQWQQTQNAQLCWYFTKTREQYRISAKVSLIDKNGLYFDNMDSQNDEFYRTLTKDTSLQASRAILWSNLSDKAKAQFYWPAPKEPVHIADLNNEVTSEIPDSFVVVCFQPFYVDYLNLTTDPQTREIHEFNETKWVYEAVNP